MSGIDGKVVAITGAGRGIGAATAELLAERGAAVVLGARSEPELSVLTERITSTGGVATHQVTDVTEAGDLDRLVETAVARFGRLDVLVSNAGVAYNSSFDAGYLTDWERMIDVNLRGFLHGVAAALPVFRAQGSGHFVTIGSTSGAKWVPGQGVYAASKAGVRAAHEVLRQEIGPQLRATLVVPGFTATDFIASTRDPEVLATLTQRRDEIAMSASAVAGAVAYAIAQPDEVNIGELVVRSTAQP